VRHLRRRVGAGLFLCFQMFTFLPFYWSLGLVPLLVLYFGLCMAFRWKPSINAMSRSALSIRVSLSP
jgi:hypothetical protein